MSKEYDKFEGQTIQFQEDMINRMDRIETKLDKMIEKNILWSTLVAGITSIVVALIQPFRK